MLWQKVFVEIKILIMRFGNLKVVFISLAFMLFASVLNAGDYIIFYDDFGELESDNEFHRSQSEYVHDVSRGGAFNYRSDCVPIKGQNFSDYAIVSTPFWSGCTFHDEYDISTCDCTEGFWFKHCFDHTHNGINPATGKYGGMLFINPQSDNIPEDFRTLVYSRTFTNTCENSFVSFSVWFRSATELWPGMSLDPIRSKLRVKHTDTGEYISEADIEIVIDAMTDTWQFGESRFFTGVGNLTVELWNLARGGQNGNDLLIDDITVKVDEPNTALVASGDNVIIDGNDVTGPCGTSYYLNVDKDEVEKSWGNPYYLWLYKTPSMNDFEPHPTFVSSSVQQPQLDVNTAYKVIVGASEQACLDYYRGSATGGCIMAVETNVVTSHCTEIHIYQNDRTDCNALSFTSSEDAYLFSSSDGSSWRNVLDVTGAPMYGSSFSVEITGDSDKLFRVGVAMSGNPNIWRYSETIQVEYYQLVQLVQEAGKASSVTNTTLYVEKGSDIELLAAAASYVGGASYSFTDVTNPDSPVAVGTLSQAQVEAGESISVSGIDDNRVFSMSAGTLSATSGLALCTANNVTVTVQDTVEIPEPDPDHGVVPIRHTGCNNVVVTSESSTDNVYWFSGVKSAASSEIEWTMIGSEPMGKVFEVEMTSASPIYYRAGVKKATAQGEGWNYSRTVELEYYQLEQLVQEAGKASSVTNTTLYVEKGSDIELLAAATSYVGGASYSFTDITNPNTPVLVGVLSQAQVEAGESISVSGIDENRVFSMSAGTLSATSGLALCTANNVTVTVQDTVEIPEPDPDHGVVPIRHTGCNNVVVTSESSTDNVYWFSGVKSAAGSEIEWTMIGSEPMGKVLEVEMTANAPRYYRAGVKKATAQGEDWNYSRTVELEYYQLEQLVQEAGKASSVTNTTLYVEKGSDIELLAAATSYVGGASYSFTDVTNPDAPAAVGTLSQAQVEAGESIMVSKIEDNRVFSMSAGTLSATSGLALCTANNVTVTVQDTVEIPEPDPDHGVVPIRHTGCNNVVVTSESSTDNVYWFSGVKSAAGSEIEWTMIGSEPMGKVLEVEMTANAPRYYRAGVKKATAQGEDWNYSRTVELEYYQLEQLVQEAGKASSVTNTTLYVEKGSDIELLAAATSYVGGASYSFTDVTNPDSPVAVGTLSQAQVEAGESIMVSKIEENRVFSMSAGTLSATSGLALCTANNVTVTVQDTVEIPEPDPDHGVVPIRHTGCNNVVVTSESSTDNVYWFSGVKSAAGSEIEWTMIGSEPMGKVFEVEMTANAPRYYRAGVKKATAQGEDWNYSRTVELEYYQLEQLVQEAGKASSVTNTTLYVEKGSDIELLAAATSYVGGASYSFTDVTNPDSPAAVGTLSQAQVEAGESIMVSKIEENRVFSMSAGTLSATSGLALCTANNVTVTVQDTVEIPEPDPDHGVVPIRHTGCNNVVVTSESSTDNVYWFSGVKSAAGSEIEWTMIGSEPMGKVFEVEMTANAPRYYRAGVKKATAQGEDWNYSRTVELEYYSVSAVIYPAGMPEQASDNVTIPYGSDIVVALGDNTYAGADAEYKFYDKDDNLIGTVKAGDTDKGVTLKNLIEDNEYHVSTGLCVSNNVSVTVLGSVTIDIKRNCNQVTADAIMEGSGQIAWYYRTTGDWQLIESASQEITLDIKENTQLKAVMGTIESEVVDVEYYDLSLSVINEGTGESSENLNIVIGAKVRLSAQATGMPGEGVYDFYDENNVLVAQMSADMPEYECAPSVDKQYYVTFSGCSSNRVNVKVDWPTVFTPYNADGFNDDFVKDVEPAIAVKVFDRSGNMVADSDNGWDGYVASGNLAMPGVYYYVAVLSDGTVRRGPIEVYKK